MIKKHRNRNDYYYAGSGLWVRNFTKEGVPPSDINQLIPVSDMQIMLHNEHANHLKGLQRIDTESFTWHKVAIVAGGLGFDKDQQLLESIPADVTILGVNETLKQWTNNQKMHFYIVNDPYETCLQLLPTHQRVWPRCIASSRTNYKFLESFNGMIYEYSPVCDRGYSGFSSEAEYFIDDYRNAVCASIGLAHQFKVQKMLLLWCDDAFETEKVGSTRLVNGNWIYPPQMISHELIDGNLFWLKSKGVKIGYHSNGPEYKHAAYITNSEFQEFFDRTD